MTYATSPGRIRRQRQDPFLVALAVHPAREPRLALC